MAEIAIDLAHKRTATSQSNGEQYSTLFVSTEALLYSCAAKGEVVICEDVPASLKFHLSTKWACRWQGYLMSACSMFDRTLIFVQPSRWQSDLGLTKIRGDSQARHKTRLMEAATAWGWEKPDLGRGNNNKTNWSNYADAWLILYWYNKALVHEWLDKGGIEYV